MQYIAVIGTFCEFEALQQDKRDEIIGINRPQAKFETSDGRTFVWCYLDSHLMGIEWDDFLTTGESNVSPGAIIWLRGAIVKKRQPA